MGRCLHGGIHVALLQGMQRRGNRIMAFTIEPDMYDNYIDRNIQASMKDLFASAEDEDEDDEKDEQVVGAIVDLAKRTKNTIDEISLLRSFVLARFIKKTLAEAEAMDAPTKQAMVIMVKALVLQAILSRHIG